LSDIRSATAAYLCSRSLQEKQTFSHNYVCR